MSKEVFELSRRMNKFILTMQKAEVLWEELTEALIYFPRDELENAPIITQKLVGMFGRAKFRDAIANIVGRAREQGGFEAMLCDLDTLKKELNFDESENEED